MMMGGGQQSQQSQHHHPPHEDEGTGSNIVEEEVMAKKPQHWKAKYDYLRRYRVEWEEMYPWLTKSDDGNENAFCKVCLCQIQPKLSGIALHEKSRKHQLRAGGYGSGPIPRRKRRKLKPGEVVRPKKKKTGDLLEMAMEPLVAAYYSSDEDPYEIKDEQLQKILAMIEPQKGNVIIEGKKKILNEIVGDQVHALVTYKIRTVTGDTSRAQDYEQKTAIYNATNAKVFTFLKLAGIRTAWIKVCGDSCFVSRRCHMIPIQWQIHRVATGAFLRRHQGVEEGFRFGPPKVETFFKDEVNDDPLCSEEQILDAKLNVGGVILGKMEYDIMSKTATAVFEVLERAWGSLDCALIDMKLEFGVDCETQDILVTNTIDPDSWRLWPSGDKRLQKDKQVYRNTDYVTEEGLNQVKRNYNWVADRLDAFIPIPKGLIVVLMGSASDGLHCEKIREQCRRMGVPCELRITSAHKGTDETLSVISRYEGMGVPVVFVASASRSNSLGPMASANTNYPVINCPPLRSEDMIKDIWSSLNIPSGLGCSTILYPEAAALSAATILALSDHVIWARIRAKKLNVWINLKHSDKKMIETNNREGNISS